MQRVVQSESTAARRRVYFTAVKVDDVTDNLVAAEVGTWIVKISKNGGGADVPSGTTVSEVDSTDFPGLWYWEGDAADFNTLGVLLVRISNSSGSKVMRERSILVHVAATDSIYVTPPANATQWAGTNVATPTTAGVPRVDVKAMEANVVTTAACANNFLTAGKIADNAIDLATIANDALLGAFGILDSGTAQSGSTSTTIKLASTASATDDAYVGAVVYTKNGTGALQVNQITDYNGTSKVASVANAWATTPDNTTTYVVKAASAPGSAPSASTVATEVWAKVLEGSFTAGDFQRLMISALVAMVSGFNTGNLVFRDLLNTKNRFIAVDDENVGRTSVSILDAT